MTPLDDVRAHVLSRLPTPVVATVPFDDADGLVLATDVTASEDVPPFDNTAVDGFAVIAADTSAAPCELQITGEMAAGASHIVSVAPGCAVRIMTGAPLPDGCDAMVMVEDTDTLSGGVVRVLRSVRAGDGIRRAGSDVRRGETPLRTGTVVTPAVQAVLATVNARTVEVYRRLRVGVLSTGDELVDDGSVLGPGQIRESNRTMLLRLVREAGAHAVDLGIVRDDEAMLESAVRAAVAGGIDVLVTSGGVSMGEYDVVKAVLSRIASMAWFQVAMKPAKPFAFGTLVGPDGRDVPVFGLPGNPVSSLVSFELIARPALEVMMGLTRFMTGRRRVRAVIDHDVKRNPDGKVHFDRCTGTFEDDGRIHVSTVRAQGSHQLAATALANAMVEVPDGNGLRAGDEVWVTLLGAGLQSGTGA